MTINWGEWMFSAVALLLLFVAGLILKDPVHLSIIGKKTKGIVVALPMSELSGQETLRGSIIKFVTLTGELIRVKSRDFSSGSSSHLGYKVTVVYNPSNPSDNQLLRLSEFRCFGRLLCFIAFIILM